MTDPDLRDVAIAEFMIKARAKFDAGIAEHNPKGDRNLTRLPASQLIGEVRNEIIDLWMYLAALEQRLLEEENLALEDD